MPARGCKVNKKKLLTIIKFIACIPLIIIEAILCVCPGSTILLGKNFLKEDNQIGRQDIKKMSS